MTEPQRVFLAQARSAHDVFRLLRATADVHHCHALHYLQVATELLSKADEWRDGYPGETHRALVPFFRRLTGNKLAKKRFGYEGDNNGWTHMLRKAGPLAEAIQRLAPALAGEGLNAEYPWPKSDPTTAPVEYRFSLWDDLTQASDGRRFLAFLEQLFDTADEFL